MSKRIALLTCVVMVLGIAPALLADIVILATDSCRTTIEKPDENNHDSSKLSVRSDAKSAKSWIKFDMNDLDVTNLETATLTVTLHQGKSGSRHFDVSYVNDDITENIDWDDRSLTWDNAPGNDIASFDNLNTGKTTLLGTVEFTDGEAGHAFTIDVLEALETDTDGIVQLVLHNSNGSMNFSTHDHSDESWRPFIDVTEGSKAQAKKPSPAIDATDVSLTPVLSWQPGAYVEGLSPKHKVYFSANFDDVNGAVGGVTQDASDTPVPNSPLDFGVTYYWRVDEANSVSGWDAGKVWAFTTEPLAFPIPGDNITVTASGFNDSDMDPNNTINGSGLDPNTGTHSTTDTDMWITDGSEDPNEPAFIMFEFDQIVRLDQMMVWNSNQKAEDFLGFGFKDVIITYSTDGTEWTRLGGEDALVQFDQAPGTAEYSGQTIGLDAAAKVVKLTALSNWSQHFQQYSLSEVQFSAIPMAARLPNPESGAENIDPRTTLLSWRSGRNADHHDVFVSTDTNDLGTAFTVADNSLALDPLNLSLNTTYYWQVSEVNEAMVPSTWTGPVWSFSTMTALVVEDFESYNNMSPDRPFQAWIDGIGFTTPPGNPGNNTGAAVGHDIWSGASSHYGGSIMETVSTMPGSGQSMPVYYDNSGAGDKLNYSQVDYRVGGQDWTTNNVGILTIAFRGTEGNTGTLYAKINNIKIPYDFPTGEIALEAWQLWGIDLASVNAMMSNVRTLSIGIDGAGASGVIYLDDIELRAGSMTTR